MVIETLLTIDDADRWEQLLPAHLSVFGSFGYARIYQQHSGFGARLFVLGSAGAACAYPFFLRPIKTLPWAAEIGEDYWDSLTPEFTGPIPIGLGGEAYQSQLATLFAAHCRFAGIVTEFAHLHPWHCPAHRLQPEFTERNREIVYIDLTIPEGRLWDESFSYACRKNIRHAQREGVRVFEATNPGDIREFYRIYTDTMTRNEALDQYFYPLAYFMAFFEQMPDSARFVLAEYRDRVVAGTLYLHDSADVYSYLGGSDYEYQNARPSNAVIYETIRWAQGRGKRRLILGGGYRSNDGIFRFKASFSPLRACFYVFKRVHLAEPFDRFCGAWARYCDGSIIPDGFFPPYRAGCG